MLQTKNTSLKKLFQPSVKGDTSHSLLANKEIAYAMNNNLIIVSHVLQNSLFHLSLQ